MPGSDFKLIDELFLRITEKERVCGHHSLTESERSVSVIWHASGILGNGGFNYFYENELDAEATAQAYEKIGCAKCAEILRLSWSLFPDSLQSASPEERIDYIRQNKDVFCNLSNLFWEADTQMERQLAEYVKVKFNN